MYIEASPCIYTELCKKPRRTVAVSQIEDGIPFTFRASFPQLRDSGESGWMDAREAIRPVPGNSHNGRRTKGESANEF